MTVTVTLNSGMTINPSFDPQHERDVVGFYTLMFWRNEIKGFLATLANGETVKIGQVA
jgi:hypothetical protein